MKKKNPFKEWRLSDILLIIELRITFQEFEQEAKKVLWMLKIVTTLYKDLLAV